MCILMVIHQGIPGYPIVVAANRDEYYDRPTQGPCQLASTPAVWGGRDARAGGTWLGINALLKRCSIRPQQRLPTSSRVSLLSATIPLICS